MSTQLKVLLTLIVISGPIAIAFLLRILQKMLDSQMEEQLKKMVPIKSIRKRISVKLKWFE